MAFSILPIFYIISVITFIVGLKQMSDPATARKGNLLAGSGMVLAVLSTLFLYRDETGSALGNYVWIFGGLLVGGVLGIFVAKKVKMTAMPEMVSLFNGMGGASAALISIIEFHHLSDRNFMITIPEAYVSESIVTTAILSLPVTSGTFIILFAGLILGSITFAGSVIAWGKLSGRVKDFAFNSQHIINTIVLLLILGLTVYMITSINSVNLIWFYVILVLSLIYGVLFVMPIGGADMPVVISLLNSLSGISAACSGFLYNNKVILTGGILVGAAGTILTILMCKAMNRSLKNVLIGSFGGGTSGGGAVSGPTDYKEISLNDSAVIMNYANKVFIVPGYGLAVAQAQHACHELEKILEAKGVQVKYAIHPVAGRMPGHMNVLLAEADVSYDKLLEMEQANDEFTSADVVLILGANDVVNPAAKSNPSSPIYGMPILDVGLAKNVIVNKRSMKPGYAGIENELFYQQKTSMLFGDAKKVLQDLIAEVKQL
ncbi:MAG: NAD(P)(+) transhydrogenase (Re/Si-specific) subunit beta [Bacteroidota bacterium]|nr:NAD(P)(+) transhydrogenase (Re/Si-specific) subunit beta [Bacteroidota bacterium]